MRIQMGLLRSIVDYVDRFVDRAYAAAQRRNPGLHYQAGWGSYQRKDFDSAFDSYRRGAELGDAKCQNELGTMYADGYGVAQDHEEALHWIRLAAEQGNPPALYNLGRAYELGQGVEADISKALQWYRLAAKKGNCSAQFCLGRSYAYGKGLPQDVREAEKWLRLAASQSDPWAQNALGVLYVDGSFGDVKEELAFQLFRDAALQGFVEAQFNLARMYREGWGAKRDLKRAYAWLVLANEGEDSDDARKRLARVAGEMNSEEIAAAEKLVNKLRARIRTAN